MIPSLVRERLRGSKRILLAGAGGGYDLLGAVPLLVELLERRDCEVHLASLSFTYLNGLDGAIPEREVPNLYEIPLSAATPLAYCPEAWLARWIAERLGRTQSVWGFEKTGVRPLVRAYRHLIERFKLDAIVLIDGGVDSLLRGDESSLGTPAEDLTSLAAVHLLDVPVKLLACVGLGAELRDGICHEQAFARIAELSQRGGHLGTSSLTAGLPASDRYREAVEFVFANQEQQRKSHIHKVILAAMRGEFGAVAPHVWLSPLLSLYWYFALPAVTGSHLFLHEISETETIWDVATRIKWARETIAIRDRTIIPI